MCVLYVCASVCVCAGRNHSQWFIVYPQSSHIFCCVCSFAFSRIKFVLSVNIYGPGSVRAMQRLYIFLLGRYSARLAWSDTRCCTLLFIRHAKMFSGQRISKHDRCYTQLYTIRFAPDIRTLHEWRWKGPETKKLDAGKKATETCPWLANTKSMNI